MWAIAGIRMKNIALPIRKTDRVTLYSFAFYNTGRELPNERKAMEQSAVYRFYKTNQGSWFIDLPHWTGPLAELQMVAGADTLLDELAQQSSEIFIELSTTRLPCFNELKLLQTLPGGGADYYLEEYNHTPVKKQLWLCDVTDFVFNHFPPAIFFRVKNNYR